MQALKRQSVSHKSIRTYPSKIHRGLWLLNTDKTEPMVETVTPTKASKLFYQSVDGILGSIDYYQPNFYSNKAPVVVLLGPLLHPSICVEEKTPWVQQLLDMGHSVFCISHRGHHNSHQSVNEILSYDHSFESMVELDISSAIHEIQIHTNSSNFHLYCSGLGSILGLMWIAISGNKNLESFQLLPWTEDIFQDRKFHILSSLPTVHTFKRLWNIQLTTQMIGSFDTLTLSERTALIHSDGWLLKDWIWPLIDWHKNAQITFDNGIHLHNALPKSLNCPVFTYGSNKTPIFNSLVTRYSDYSFTGFPLSFPIVDKDFGFNTTT